MTRRGAGRIASVVAASTVMLAAGLARADARAGAPPPLSADRGRVDVSSSFGSGVFGTWHADEFGLPAYRYTMDQQHDPRAAQVETGGTTTFHQVGNDAHHAFATNDGYTQLWSQARLYQWANYYQPSASHFAGGYGYLNVDGKVVSTLYDDRPAGAYTDREFGMGYFEHRLDTSAVGVDEHVYAPFGTDPVLLHDITITNHSSSPQQLSWFEYWDVNPAMQPGLPGYGPRNRGLTAPTHDPVTGTLSVGQLPDLGYADPHTADTDPLSIFAAPLAGPVSSFTTSVSSFFGSGGRAAPDAATAGHLDGALAPPSPGGEAHPGSTLFAYQAPLSLAPGASTTLRYAYGMAHPAQIPGLVARWKSARQPLASSERSWASWVPQATFPQAPWLGRELQWDAYMVRSRATPEEGCGGGTVLSQGAWYQYDWGFQGAYRDPLEHALPMVFADPEQARQVVTYSAHEQDGLIGSIPYALYPMCTPDNNGESSDLDVWLLMAAAEYGLGQRNPAFFDQQVPYLNGGTASLWDHLKLAFRHQEQVIGRGPHGLPLNGTTGDWRDFGTVSDQLTETTLVATQLAYVYPRVAELAALRGDAAFAAQLRTAAASLDTAIAGEWTDGGWYSRGYAGALQVGSNQIFNEPQAWAVLAGLPTPDQERRLAANERRYLAGVGAAGGPSIIGSALQPAPSDGGGATPTEQAAGAVPYAWFAIDGPLAWSLAASDRAVTSGDDFGWDEMLRNTLANHASVQPAHWNGVISADDVCTVWYVAPPYKCGTSPGSTFDTQNLHQPAWGLETTLKLAGIDGVGDGYAISPHVPGQTFSFRLPTVGLDERPGQLRGYVVAQESGAPAVHLTLPDGTDPATVRAFAGGRPVDAVVSGGVATFTLTATAGRPADWAVTWTPPTAVPPVAVWQPPASPPGSTPSLPANCTAPAGGSCQFQADSGSVQGYIAALDAGTSFRITDEGGAVVASGTGPSANPAERFLPGSTYTVSVTPGSGEVIAGSPT